MPFMSSNFDLFSASATLVYVVSYDIKPCYKDIKVYVMHLYVAGNLYHRLVLKNAVVIYNISITSCSLPEPLPPGAPQNLTEGQTKFQDGRMTVMVHWDPPVLSDLPVARYKVGLNGLNSVFSLCILIVDSSGCFYLGSQPEITKLPSSFNGTLANFGLTS